MHLRKAYKHNITLSIRKFAKKPRTTLVQDAINKQKALLQRKLQHNLKRYCYIDGDKGKISGITTTNTVRKLVKSFLSTAELEGRYIRLTRKKERRVDHMHLMAVKHINKHILRKIRTNGIYSQSNRPGALEAEKVHTLNTYISFLAKDIPIDKIRTPILKPTIKFHKEIESIRPIVSKWKTPSITLGKIINRIILRLRKDTNDLPDNLNPYNGLDTIRDIYMAKITSNNINLEEYTQGLPITEYGFFTIDVINMFDNISMEQVINIIKLLANDSLPYNIDNALLEDLIVAESARLNYIKYEDHFWKQIKGIPMGGNTSSVYANLFMDHHIKKCRQIMDNLGVILIKKYVDDILIYMPINNIMDLVHTLSNSTRLGFEITKPVNNTTVFLDIAILNRPRDVLIKWHKKPICSDRLPNEHTFILRHHIVNTYASRIRYALIVDTGPNIMGSIHTIINEILQNQITKETTILILNKTKGSTYGANGEYKQIILNCIYRNIDLIYDTYKIAEDNIINIKLLIQKDIIQHNLQRDLRTSYTSDLKEITEQLDIDHLAAKERKTDKLNLTNKWLLDEDGFLLPAIKIPYRGPYKTRIFKDTLTKLGIKVRIIHTFNNPHVEKRTNTPHTA